MGVAAPIVPPSSPGTAGGWADPDESDRAAVVAHALLNTLAVLALAGGTLASSRESLPPSVQDELLSTILRQCALLGDAMVFVLPTGPESFNIAAAGIVASGVVLAAAIVAAWLDDTVRGLPVDVIEFLASLRS